LARRLERRPRPAQGGEHPDRDHSLERTDEAAGEQDAGLVDTPAVHHDHSGRRRSERGQPLEIDGLRKSSREPCYQSAEARTTAMPIRVD
jgi:hypothetical protein